MKLVIIAIVLLFTTGYICTYVLARNGRRAFLSGHARERVRSFGVTCFFIAIALCLLILYIRIRR